MFGKKRQTKPIPKSTEVGLLGVNTCLRGDLRFRGTLRIDGEVQGSVIAEPGSGSVLVINQNAGVTGLVVADSVQISGTVDGDVIAHGQVGIYRKGIVKGDLYTDEIMIEVGGVFQGSCHMIHDLTPDEQSVLLARSKGQDPAPPLNSTRPQDVAEKQYTA